MQKLYGKKLRGKDREETSNKIPFTEDISKIKGIVKRKRKRKVSLEEMKKAVRLGAEERLK